MGTDTQTQFTITNPTCFDATSLSAILSNPSMCGPATANAQTIMQVTPTYHSPYSEQLSTSLERQLTKTTSLSVTYLRTYGVHQMVTRDANAYLPGDYVFNSDGTTTINHPRPMTTPDNKLGIVQQYDSEAVFKQHQLIVNINARLTPKLGVSGFYNWTTVKSDTGTASNSYNLLQDYRRAGFASPNMVFVMGNYTGPLNITFNPFLIAQGGRPYNFVTPNDLTGDNFYNNRPSLVAASNCTSPSTRYIETAYGCFDAIPPQGEPPIPGNMGTGPAAVAVNLRISRAFGLGPKLEGASGSNNGDGPGGGPGMGGPPLVVVAAALEAASEVADGE